MYVKMMNPGDLADSDPRKTFHLFADVISFEISPGQPMVQLTYRDKRVEVMPIIGNIYIMNDDGKTIEKCLVARDDGKPARN